LRGDANELAECIERTTRTGDPGVREKSRNVIEGDCTGVHRDGAESDAGRCGYSKKEERSVNVHDSIVDGHDCPLNPFE
jgi:hypothetical protein